MPPVHPAQALPTEPALPTRVCPCLSSSPPLLPAPEALHSGMAGDVPSAVTMPPYPRPTLCSPGSQDKLGRQPGGRGPFRLRCCGLGVAPPGACACWPGSAHRRSRQPEQSPAVSGHTAQEGCLLRHHSMVPEPQPEPWAPGIKGWRDCLWNGKGVGAFLKVKVRGRVEGGAGGGAGGPGQSLTTAGKSQLLATCSGCCRGLPAWAWL